MKLLAIYQLKKLWLSLFIVWTFLIIVLSVIPISRESASQGTSLIRLDYLEHFLSYFAFAGLYILWRSDKSFRISRLELIIMPVVVTGFSILTEVIQLFIPGRAFNPLDAAYNLAGALFSFLVIYIFFIRYHLRKRSIQE